MCSGFTADIIEKLRSNGISKLTDLISRDTEDVCQLTGVSYKVCFKVIGFRASTLLSELWLLNSDHDQ